MQALTHVGSEEVIMGSVSTGGKVTHRHTHKSTLVALVSMHHLFV